MTELDVEARFNELNAWYQAAMRDRKRLQAENLKLRAALEDRDRLRAACQRALEAIAPCVVGWDYPDVPPMPQWAKRLESVVPPLQAALGIPATKEGARDG